MPKPLTPEERKRLEGLAEKPCWLFLVLAVFAVIGFAANWPRNPEWAVAEAAWGALVLARAWEIVAARDKLWESRLRGELKYDVGETGAR